MKSFKAICIGALLGASIPVSCMDHSDSSSTNNAQPQPTKRRFRVKLPLRIKFLKKKFKNPLIILSQTIETELANELEIAQEKIFAVGAPISKIRELSQEEKIEFINTNKMHFAQLKKEFKVMTATMNSLVGRKKYAEIIHPFLDVSLSIKKNLDENSKTITCLEWQHYNQILTTVLWASENVIEQMAAYRNEQNRNSENIE